MHNIATNCKSRVGRSTAFYKDLASIYLKDVNNHGFNQSYHDTSSWYHRTVASIECLQALLFRSGSPGTCLQATKSTGLDGNTGDF